MGMGSWWEDMVCVWLLVLTLVCWLVYWLAVRFDSNSPRGPAHASGTEFYPVLRLIELPSILGRIIVNFPIFRSKNRKFNIIKIPCLGTGTSPVGTCLYRFSNQVRDTLIFYSGFMDTCSSTGLKQVQSQVDASSYLNRPCPLNNEISGPRTVMYHMTYYSTLIVFRYCS